MLFNQVCLEAFGYTLPEEVVTSDELETQLAPAYERLKLPPGRLELLTGIRQRRFFPRGVAPSAWSILSAGRAIEASGVHPRYIGALIHGSVCRDFLEPATACGVHHALDLPAECLAYDVSNACLGILTGMLQAANMIELGQIRAALIVGTECGRTLVDNTVRRLNTDGAVNRKSVKHFVASLTIGSASVAVLLCDRELSRTQNRLTAAAALANTAEHKLCQSEGHDEFMRTDSEALMRAGVETGSRTFERFLQLAEWTRDDVDKTVCHQVGVAHRKLLFESLGLLEERDFATFPWLGNTGAAALPTTVALAAQTGWLRTNDRTAMLGIGSGLNCQMLAVEWRKSLVSGNAPRELLDELTAQSAPAATQAVL